MEAYIYCKSCKCVSRINNNEDIEKTGCPSCGSTGCFKELKVKQNSIPENCENKFVKCSHCEQIMFEYDIILAGDCEIECCPHCGRDGGLVRNFKDSEIVEYISKWLQMNGHEEASKALDCQFEL